MQAKIVSKLLISTFPFFTSDFYSQISVFREIVWNRTALFSVSQDSTPALKQYLNYEYFLLTLFHFGK